MLVIAYLLHIQKDLMRNAFCFHQYKKYIKTCSFKKKKKSINSSIDSNLVLKKVNYKFLSIILNHLFE